MKMSFVFSPKKSPQSIALNAGGVTITMESVPEQIAAESICISLDVRPAKKGKKEKKPPIAAEPTPVAPVVACELPTEPEAPANNESTVSCESLSDADAAVFASVEENWHNAIRETMALCKCSAAKAWKLVQDECDWEINQYDGDDWDDSMYYPD